MIALQQTNDMLRGLGFNVPAEDDRVYDPEFGYLADYHLADHREPTVMDAAGWGDHTEVDVFIMLPMAYRQDYAEGMGFDFE